MSNNNTTDSKDSSNNAGERLQNVLAKRGIASRRGSADIIQAGEVTVNSETIREPGYRVNPKKDSISVRGKKIDKDIENKKTILLYKPRGLICSADNSQGDTVCDLLSQQISERLVPVGRLDRDSEGLLIMSNDGELTNIMTHPRYGHKKGYNVKVSGELDESKVAILGSRMDIDGYFIKPVEIVVLKSSPRSKLHKLSFTMGEGRNRQIRKMCEQVGLRIVSLQRVRIGPLRVGEMRPGDWRELHKNDIAELFRKAESA